MSTFRSSRAASSYAPLRVETLADLELSAGCGLAPVLINHLLVRGDRLVVLASILVGPAHPELGLVGEFRVREAIEVLPEHALALGIVLHDRQAFAEPQQAGPRSVVLRESLRHPLEVLDRLLVTAQLEQRFAAQQACRGQMLAGGIRRNEGSKQIGGLLVILQVELRGAEAVAGLFEESGRHVRGAPLRGRVELAQQLRRFVVALGVRFEFR